jgi:hypothetical protein
MKIISITTGSYPIGEATTNRNLSILKGLVHYGNEVELLVLSPSNKIVKGKRLKEGIIHGIKFRYTSYTIEWPSSSFHKIIILLFSLIKALWIISESHRHKNIDVIIFQMSRPFLMHPFMLFARLKR